MFGQIANRLTTKDGEGNGTTPRPRKFTSKLEALLDKGLEELLWECADALRAPERDEAERRKLVKEVERALPNVDARDHTNGLMLATGELLSCPAPHPFEPQTNNDTVATDLATAIEVHLGGPQFIYHGTIFGRLGRIAGEGIAPGKARVWTEQFVPDWLLSGAVFFATTWRGAMWWAEIASLKAKGPSSSKARCPAVIRVPTDALELLPDPAAIMPGCLMSREKVEVGAAKVLVGRPDGLPNWQNFQAALSS